MASEKKIACVAEGVHCSSLYDVFKKVKRQGNFRRKVKSRVKQILIQGSQNSILNQGSNQSVVQSVVENGLPDEMDINQFESEEIELNNLLCNDSDTESDQFNIIENDEHDDFSNMQQVFREKLTKWAINVNANHHQVRELLALCNETLPFKLPIDPRTIFGTPQSIIVQEIAGGQYWHRGMIESLNAKLKCVNSPPSKITLNINIDGLPISESSNQQFWPILFNIHELQHIEPGVIGIFYGKSNYFDLKYFIYILYMF